VTTVSKEMKSRETNGTNPVRNAWERVQSATIRSSDFEETDNSIRVKR
jgi:hypothetical protein